MYVRMYVCMYVCIYVCVCMYVCMCVCMYVCINICMLQLIFFQDTLDMKDSSKEQNTNQTSAE